MILLRLGAWLSCLLLVAPAFSDERILSFDSDISLQADASLMVTETIRVRAEGQTIRRGLLRDFPTQYRDRLGNRVQVSFQVLDVERDGQPDAWRTESLDNGVRLRIGRSNVFLDTGEHVYRIRYRTERQLGFFEEHDELYWNVTGTGWPFAINQASATVRLPSSVPWASLQTAVYTGRQGERGSDAQVDIVDGRTVRFYTTQGLPARAGLTLSLGFPKGMVTAPDTGQKVLWFLRDNGAALVLLIGFGLALAWYQWAWRHKGKDPRKGVIFPRFEPPKGLSPAGCRYVLDMGLDPACFTAAVISLGVKGYLKIDEQEDRFLLYRGEDEPREAASAGEQAVFDALLYGEDGWIELDQENHAVFRAARGGLKAALDQEHKGRLFNLNGLYALPAVGISLLAALVAAPFEGAALVWVTYVAASVVLHGLFIFLLRAPTVVGRHIMDEIEGFRMYLKTAERDRLERMRSPQLTPEVFEHFLPYAFALGVENQWCRRFQAEFPHAQDESGGYQPAWYSGHLGQASSMNHIASGLGSGLSSAIASASSPPGSSSGGGGGGFSGGGGGGGGGGGW